LHMHHWFIGILLALFQPLPLFLRGFGLGLFIEGSARWSIAPLIHYTRKTVLVEKVADVEIMKQEILKIEKKPIKPETARNEAITAQKSPTDLVESKANDLTEKIAKQKAAKALKEKAIRDARKKERQALNESVERQAVAKAERVEQERVQREAKEAAEREARERAEKPAREAAMRERAQREAREARDAAEREVKIRAEMEAKEKEGKKKKRAAKAANELVERQMKEEAEREEREKVVFFIFIFSQKKLKYCLNFLEIRNRTADLPILQKSLRFCKFVSFKFMF
jgi:hypothetical protein